MADKDAVEQILTAVQTGIKTRGELRSLTGLHYSAINDALDELTAAGKVEPVETVNKTYYRFAGSHEVPPDPREAAPAAPRPTAPPAQEEEPVLPAEGPGRGGATKGDGEAVTKRASKKGGKKSAKKGRARGRRPRLEVQREAPATTHAPPPFSQNGFASALRAAALEFEYQAFWKEPSPKAETVKSMVAEAAAHLDQQ